MVKYRDHRGLLVDSMKTVRDIDSIGKLKEHLNEVHGLVGVVEEVKIKPYFYDSRIGWDTNLVTFRFEGDNVFYPTGFTDGFLS